MQLPLCIVVDISTKVPMSTLYFHDKSTNTQSHVALLMLYKHKCHQHTDCVLLCCYISKHETRLCAFVDLPSTMQSAHWPVVDTSTKMQSCICTVDDWSTKCQLALCICVKSKSLVNTTNRSTPTQLKFRCATHNFMVSTLFRLYLNCICGSNMSCWNPPKCTYAYTQMKTCAHTISCDVPTFVLIKESSVANAGPAAAPSQITFSQTVSS